MSSAQSSANGTFCMYISSSSSIRKDTMYPRKSGKVPLQKFLDRLGTEHVTLSMDAGYIGPNFIQTIMVYYEFFFNIVNSPAVLGFYNTFPRNATKRETLERTISRWRCYHTRGCGRCRGRRLDACCSAKRSGKI